MNPSTALAHALLAELVHQGVREVVLSPGSRSAPLAFEVLRLERAGLLRLHVRVDERSAGFLALGLAKVSGAPVAVICTSGTAVANLAPAVVEASYSAVPLVVVTADRPVESRGIGATQTIDQVQFFGEMVRFFADVGASHRTDPDDPLAAQRAARASAGMALAAAFGARGRGSAGLSRGALETAHGGPVHLNVGFRLPLVPEPAGQPVSGDFGEELGDGPAIPPRPRRPPLAGCDIREIGEVLGEVPSRGLLLVGDLPSTSLRGHHQWLSELASACGWPIVAEPSANLHDAPTALGHGVLVLGAEGFLAAHQPDLVLSAGHFGLSRPTMELLRRAHRHVAIELPSVGREICDPLRTAQQVLGGIPLPPSAPEPDAEWLAAWQWGDRVAAEVVAELVLGAPGSIGTPIAAPDSAPAGAGMLGSAPVVGSAVVGKAVAGRAVDGKAVASAAFTGSEVAARVWMLAAADSLLLVAASWPARQLEAFAGRRPGVRVVGNRGANGIDGLVSTAWGAALAHQAAGGGPALALLGDLAFLHDHSGLLVGAEEPRPDLLLVVTDNDGGGIFHQLEQGAPAYAGSFERIFGTPLGRDLVAVATAAGVSAERVHTGAQLVEAVERALARGGVRVVVASVLDRAGEAALMGLVRDTVAARIETLQGAGAPRV